MRRMMIGLMVVGLVLGSAGVRSAPAQSELQAPREEPGPAASFGWGMAAVGTNIGYMPAKMLYALGGGLVGLLAWGVTAGNDDVAMGVLQPALGGHLGGHAGNAARRASADVHRAVLRGQTSELVAARRSATGRGSGSSGDADRLPGGRERRAHEREDHRRTGRPRLLLAVGWYVFHLQRQAAKWKNAKEIVEESFNKDSGVATARYVGVIDGPIDKVQDAVWDVEHVSQMVQNFKKSELMKQEGNSKTVLMQLQALNLPLQQYTMEFTLDAAKHQVTFKTMQSQAADLEGSYKLEASPDGQKTRMIYEVKSTDKIAVPFPASVIESANREVFVNTVRGVEKAVKAPPGAAELARAASAAPGGVRRRRGAPRSAAAAAAARGRLRRALQRRQVGAAQPPGRPAWPGARQQDPGAHAADQFLRRRPAACCSSICPATASPACRWRVKEQWRVLVEGYLTGRRTLRGVVVLVDVRRGIQADDARLLDFLAAHGIAALVVATKVDKLARGARRRHLDEIAAQWAAPIPFSAVSGEGVRELWSAIEALWGS